MVSIYNNRGRNITIQNNTIIHSKQDGIYLWNANDTIIEGNMFYNNTLSAVNLAGSPTSNNTLIYRNSFFSHPNSYIRGSFLSDTKYNTTIGNFWETYTGIDSNQDGLGDTEYSIDAGNADIDSHPIVVEHFTQFYPVPMNMTIDFLDSESVIDWFIAQITLFFPICPRGISNYTLLLNGSVQRSDLYHINESIIEPLIGLSIGEYNYTLIISDGWNHHLNHSVYVTVKNFDPILQSFLNFGNNSFVSGTSNNVINFTLNDPSILIGTACYNLTIDGTLVETNKLITSDLVILRNLDSLTIGIHDIMVVVIDGYGGIAQKTLTINITSPLDPDTPDDTPINEGDDNNGSNDNLIYIIVGTVLVGILIYFLLRKRKKVVKTVEPKDSTVIIKK